jgi:uncharacterized protein (DUF2141 family)
MNRLVLFFILIFEMVSICTGQSSNDKGVLTVKLVGFRNDTGQTCVQLYNNPIGFPGKYANAYRIAHSPIKNDQATIEFQELPYGSYAISVLHDENMNNKLELSFLGIPKEGCAVSNDPKIFLGPPSFEDAKFEIQSNSKTIEIRLKYF